VIGNPRVIVDPRRKEEMCANEEGSFEDDGPAFAFELEREEDGVRHIFSSFSPIELTYHAPNVTEHLRLSPLPTSLRLSRLLRLLSTARQAFTFILERGRSRASIAFA
jgi:hypothetical protein